MELYYDTNDVNPTQGVQKEKHRRIFTKSLYQQKKQPKQNKKLQKNTHTRNGVFPPVVVGITKSHLAEGWR